jgi:hypothetical protein
MTIKSLDDVKTVDQIKSDPKLFAAFFAHSKKSLCSENLLFYFDKGNAQGVYPKYLDKKSATQVNVDATLLNAAQKLGEAGNWNDPAFPKVIEKAKKAVGEMIMADTWPKFIKTDAAKALYPPPRKVGDPAKAAKLLGIADVARLKKAMNTDDAKTREKLFEQIAAEEKLARKAKEVMAALEKAGLM